LRVATQPKPKPASARNDAEACPHFAAFWNEYPRKAKKPVAATAFAKAGGHDINVFNAIMAGLEVWKRSRDWHKDNGQFIQYPANWLKARMWEDSPKPKAALARGYDLVDGQSSSPTRDYLPADHVGNSRKAG
jgi:hypothetical protein